MNVEWRVAQENVYTENEKKKALHTTYHIFMIFHQLKNHSTEHVSQRQSCVLTVKTERSLPKLWPNGLLFFLNVINLRLNGDLMK